MSPDVADADLPLERDLFLRTLIRELAGVLQDTVGMERASGYVALVGQAMGDWINTSYRRALGQEKLDRAQVAEILTDLKRRINGTFALTADDGATLTYENGRCPFEDRVVGRPAMCMMTSNVFGSIAAENLGYAKVELEETIAEGSHRCLVHVHLDPDAASGRDGREYFAVDG